MKEKNYHSALLQVAQSDGFFLNPSSFLDRATR